MKAVLLAVVACLLVMAAPQEPGAAPPAVPAAQAAPSPAAESPQDAPKTAEHATGHAAAKGGHGEPHDGEHAGDPYLVWKIVNFAVLLVALGYFMGKKGGPFFRARTEEIRRGIDEAAKARHAADLRAAQVEEQLKRLDQEIAALRSEARREAAAEGERVRAETARHMAKIRATAEQEILSATKAARQQLRAYSAELALELAEQQIRGRVTPDVQARLLDRFVSGLGQERVQ